MAGASGDDFQALVHLVDRTVASLGRLQTIVDETLEKLETLQHQLRAIEEERLPRTESASRTSAEPFFSAGR